MKAHWWAAMVLVAATPIATWWVVGDLSGTAIDDPDFLYRPLDLAPATEDLVGAGATLLVLATATALAVGVARHEVDLRRWWSVLVPLLAAGALAGTGWRVVTAGVIGANIGGGLVLLFVAPIVLGLVVWAAGRASWLLLSSPR